MTSRIGWVLPTDRLAPREVVDLAVRADAAGFCGVLAVDAFQPWLPQLGQAPFVWGLVAAVGERTRFELGVGMAVAGDRMHPAAIAQAAATTAALYPGRVWVSLGAGDAINEVVGGSVLPEAPERIGRLFEALEVITKLYAVSTGGKSTRFEGRYFTMGTARVWTMPQPAPQLLVATNGPTTAHRAGRIADGLLVVGAPLDRAGTLIQRFDEGVAARRRAGGRAGGRADRGRRVMYLNLSWAPQRSAALAAAVTRFPMGAMRFARGDIRSPFTVAQIARLVRAEDIEDSVLVTSDPGEVRGVIQAMLELGFDQVYLNNVGDNHGPFLDMCAAELALSV